MNRVQPRSLCLELFSPKNNPTCCTRKRVEELVEFSVLPSKYAWLSQFHTRLLSCRFPCFQVDVEFVKTGSLTVDKVSTLPNCLSTRLRQDKQKQSWKYSRLLSEENHRQSCRWSFSVSRSCDSPQWRVRVRVYVCRSSNQVA